MKHNITQSDLSISEANPNTHPNSVDSKSSCPCSVSQLLAIFIPIGILGLFCAIFLPIYLTHHNHHDKVIYIRENETSPINNNSYNTTNTAVINQTEEEFDEFEECSKLYLCNINS